MPIVSTSLLISLMFQTIKKEGCGDVNKWYENLVSVALLDHSYPASLLALDKHRLHRLCGCALKYEFGSACCSKYPSRMNKKAARRR